MIRFPNCKINLGLYITRRRDDGYHDLETVFYPVPVCDALEVVPAEKAQLHMTGKAVAGDTTNNLVWKAYILLKERFPNKVQELDIYLHKAIPMGAGMGGGSADGAYMLSLINDYCNLGLDKKELAEMALLLGSDCPFFIYNTPQYATGRGEQMVPVSLDLSSYSLQLVCPGVHVSTAKAFSMITPQPVSYDLRQLDKLPVNEWRGKISNDFEAPVFKEHPELAAVKKQLYDAGAIYAAMSGSGSTVFGIFEKGKRAAFEEKGGWEVFYIEQM
ncbi:4-(cytidine 5'-diphospho)-2-C-methyl-D-erythritol kinase [Chitinophagaceae bacterium MMS25-I14]